MEPNLQVPVSEPRSNRRAENNRYDVMIIMHDGEVRTASNIDASQAHAFINLVAVMNVRELSVVLR